MFWVQVGLLGALGLVVGRMVIVDSAFGPSLVSAAAKVEDNSHVVLAQRGSILDRNGQVLAYDVPAYMLDIKTDGFSDLSQLADELAQPLGQPASQVLKVLQSGNGHWVRWPNPVLATQQAAVQAAVGKDHSQDVTFTPTEERFYPFGDFAANTIGFVNHMGQAVNGLEAEYNQVLQGTNGELRYTQDRWGFPIQSTVQVVKPAIPGEDLETTIDSTIQGFVEQAMNQLVQKYNPAHAAIIVTDPNTGSVLAMASRPTFNPNDYAQASSEALNDNWAVDASFEPGSTFKPLTLAAALATHSISLNQTFMSGHTTIDGQTIYDWNIKGWGDITYQMALEKSSNVGFAKIALALGWPNLLHYMQVFGYLNPTGIDLPGEATSQIFPPDERHTVELATSGFGQGISVTPLQQVAAIGAIANGGKLIRPHLAKALIDPKTGKVVETFKPVVENQQVVPPDVIAAVNHTLVLDVDSKDGIDQVAQIPGYYVAGKTGTANKVDPKTGKYYANRFIVSFIGYAPATRPKYEVYVTVDWPKTPIGSTWGSTIAAPAAKQILEECLQYGHVPPDDPSSLPAANQSRTTSGNSGAGNAGNGAAAMRTVPSVVGLAPQQARSRLQQAGFTPQVVGGGGSVTAQWPSSGDPLAKGGTVLLLAPGGSAKPSMPNLVGVPLREAIDLLSTLGVQVTVHGAGSVQAQSVAPGQSLPAKVTLTCQPPVPFGGATSASSSARAQGNSAG